MPAGAFGFTLQLPTGLQMFIMDFLAVNPSFVRCISLEALWSNWQTSADRWHKETQRTKNVSESYTLASSKILKINCCRKAWTVTWKSLRKTPRDSSSSSSFQLLLNNIQQPFGFDKMWCKRPWVVYRKTERERNNQRHLFSQLSEELTLKDSKQINTFLNDSKTCTLVTLKRLSSFLKSFILSSSCLSCHLFSMNPCWIKAFI